MRYSILGFSQEKVIEITKAVDGKQYRLDVTDLLILQEMADFMNRKKIIKHIINDEEYFSIRYDAILEDLPILNIEKRALRVRVEKICLLGILERQVIKDNTGSWAVFRLTEKYEELIYDGSQKNEGVGKIFPTGGKNNAYGGGKNFTDQNTNILNQNYTTTSNEGEAFTPTQAEKKKSSSAKQKKDMVLDSNNRLAAAADPASRYGRFMKWAAQTIPDCYNTMAMPTENQLATLMSTYGDSAVIDIFETIENRQDIRGKYKSLYLTAKNWLKRDEQKKQ